MSRALSSQIPLSLKNSTQVHSPPESSGSSVISRSPSPTPSTGQVDSPLTTPEIEVEMNHIAATESPGKKENGAFGTEMSRSASDSQKSPTRSTFSSGPSGLRGVSGRSSLDGLHPSTATRARSPSPSPLKNTDNGAGFASSSSYHTQSPGTESRERIVSPTKATFENGGTLPVPLPIETGVMEMNRGLGIMDQGSPLWSPAIDGKKEPSIKPPPSGFQPFDPNLYAHPNSKSRARSPYPASLSPGAGPTNQKPDYAAHPLSGQAYNQTTMRETSNFGLGEKFTDSPAYWLGLYFFFNLGLTLFNKIVLVSFPFPYTLTGLHALSGCAGTYLALERGAFVPARLTQKETLILAAFSVLYTINIAVSNISLQLVTVPFHQVVRASTPLFTILISTIVLRTRFSLMKLVSLLPVVAGVGFATYGDYYFTAWGLILTLLGTFLAALKTVVTNLIQTGSGQRLKLHPMDLLMRMSPLAFIQCVIYGWYTGELERVRAYGATQMTRSKAIALLVNGVIACGLNIVSFTANKKAGALTMTVSANCKQVLTIALAVVLFDLHISFTNGIGILLTLIGGGWYGYVEYTEKTKKNKLLDRS